jgi:desulfoferrodoxin (superoxide reductase-like protein)
LEINAILKVDFFEKKAVPVLDRTTPKNDKAAVNVSLDAVPERSPTSRPNEEIS